VVPSAAPEQEGSANTAASTSASDESIGEPFDPEEIMWSQPDDDIFLNADIDIDELAMEVAEEVALQSMSRMCRKGMGYRRGDDPRLRGAEFAIDPEAEIKKLIDALDCVRGMPVTERPAALWSFHKALAGAWRAWRERDAHDRLAAPSHACLGEPWHHEYEQPATYGLVRVYTELWFETLKTLFSHPAVRDACCEQQMAKCDIPMEHRDHETPRPVLESVPKFGQEIVTELAKTADFLKLLEPLRTGQPESFLPTYFDFEAANAACEAEEAEEAAKEAAVAADAAARAQGAADRKKRHRDARKKKLRPGDTCCWECCIPFRRGGMELAREECDENSDGDQVLYCSHCWRERNDVSDEDDEDWDEDDEFDRWDDPRFHGY